MTPTNKELEQRIEQFNEARLETALEQSNLIERIASSVHDLGADVIQNKLLLVSATHTDTRRLLLFLCVLSLIVAIHLPWASWRSSNNEKALAAHIVEQNMGNAAVLAVLRSQDSQDDEFTVMMRIDAGLLAQALEDNAGLLAMMGPHVQAMDRMTERIGLLERHVHILEETSIRIEADGTITLGLPDLPLPPDPEPWPSLEGPAPNVGIEPGDLIIEGDLEIDGTGDGVIIHGELLGGSIHIHDDLWKEMLAILDDDPTTDTWSGPLGWWPALEPKR